MGRGCQSAKRKGFQDFSRLPESFASSYAKLIVDKSGVNPTGERGDCTRTFANYYSIDQRVVDHLRAIQHLRKHASWWNGDIYLVGWSDGASIGVSVAAYTTEVKRAVFLGMGGGISMVRQFEDYILCAPDRTDARETCIEDLNEVFAEIRANPSPEKTWFGDGNTYNAWATRIDMVEYHLLKDFRVPILIIHGADDRDSVPIESARELVRMLKVSGEVDFEYWEVPDADHNIGIHTEGKSEAVRLAMLNWLLQGSAGDAGPPGFGLPLVE